MHTCTHGGLNDNRTDPFLELFVAAKKKGEYNPTKHIKLTSLKLQAAFGGIYMIRIIIEYLDICISNVMFYRKFYNSVPVYISII